MFYPDPAKMSNRTLGLAIARAQVEVDRAAKLLIAGQPSGFAAKNEWLQDLCNEEDSRPGV